MLAQWVAPTTIDGFRATHLHREPWARPGATRAAVRLFGWDTLDRVLAAAPPSDVLVVSRGTVLEVRPPRSLADLRLLMAMGVGLVIHHGERHDPGLAGVADAFEHDLPGEVHVQLFVTPAGTHGFGWHYDAEDVFIAQTAGAKDYYFRANTVDTRVPGTAGHDFSRIANETSPLMTARLLPGDGLYIPARWWHMAESLADSLSISVGVIPQP